ncbi:NAD(P)-binding domain-containing protein [Actinoallomurus soli]|uniref:NAD(P)-binding domain-containing protein n=1 Tax=Actinoallomurus soli TaxID=2952535 RepID=UPI002092D248|nr:NAD(P)-binding domain-containing protein [Actinoallomurus soli]MCO5969609.1 adenosylhomocysteinase [Actinoallomurus soli]
MTALEDFELSRVDAFFRRITSRYEASERVSALVITHLLGERPAFLRAVGRLAEIAAVLPKPKSIDSRALEQITALLPVDGLERAAFADPARALEYLEVRAAGRRIVLLDVGGYFAPGLEHVCADFSGQVVGVVEDTENGHQRYEALGKLPCPVFSVARSPLKDPEDYLVGQSVTFSAEALIRARGDILQGRPAAVIGYGKLGRSVAAMLHAKHVGVTVYDCDPIRRTQALSQGFRTTSTLAQAIAGAGVIVCATGNLALREDDFAKISNGAYIAWQDAVAQPGHDITPVDIDLHTIPANPAKGEPEHWHADFRWLLRVQEPKVVLQAEEVDGYAWRPCADAPTPKLAKLATRLVQHPRR